MTDWSVQRYFEDVHEGEEIPAISFPISIQRLVMEAGANRDFASIHHNREIAQSGGAPDMYANNVFLQAMWERAIQEWIGLEGRIRKVGPFRMRIFSPAGDTCIVSGKVIKKFQDGGQNLVELEVQSSSQKTGNINVGPAPVLITLPSRPL